MPRTSSPIHHFRNAGLDLETEFVLEREGQDHSAQSDM